MDLLEVLGEILILLSKNNTSSYLKQLLKEKKIDINHTHVIPHSNFKVTLLLQAVRYLPSTIPTLLECGANPIQILGGRYNTPFDAAVKTKRKNIVLLFIEYHVELPNDILDTAIHTSSNEIIEILMDAGATEFSEYPPKNPCPPEPCHIPTYESYLHAKKYALVIRSRINRCKEAIYGVYLLKDSSNKDILFMVSRLVWKERRNRVWLPPPHNN